MGRIHINNLKIINVKGMSRLGRSSCLKDTETTKICYVEVSSIFERNHYI